MTIPERMGELERKVVSFNDTVLGLTQRIVDLEREVVALTQAKVAVAQTPHPPANLGKSEPKPAARVGERIAELEDLLNTAELRVEELEAKVAELESSNDMIRVASEQIRGANKALLAVVDGVRRAVGTAL